MWDVMLAKAEFDSWKPEVDHRLAYLEHAVNYLGKRMERFFGVHSKQGVTGGMSNIEHLDDDPKFTVGDKATSSGHLESPSLEAAPGPFRYHA